MMVDYPIDLLIKQTLRSVVFDSTNMGLMLSRAQHIQAKSYTSKTAAKESVFCTLLRSPETIKWLFERPNEYMYKIFEHKAFKDALDGAKDEVELKSVKNKILFGFLKELRDSRAPQALEWTMFQHFMYYVYRNFLTPKPAINDEGLSSAMVKKIFKLVVSLTFEDKAQFYVRIITLLREYVMTARDNYEELTVTSDATVYLKCLLSYYSAFCSAASKVTNLLADFDQFMNMRYHINWYCLNQRMFFQYFFMRPSVQCKVSVFNKMAEEDKASNKELLHSYNSFVEEMGALDRHWEFQRRRISFLSDRNPKDEPQWLQKDWKLFEEITRIMKTNFWIIRNNDWTNNEQANELDGHFLAIVEDTWHVADRLIAPEGNCICEDCMAAEFLQSLVTGSVQQPLGSAKLVMCYLCRDVMTVNLLGSHFISKHDDSNSPRSEFNKSYKWQTGVKKALLSKRPSSKLSKVISETMEIAKSKESGDDTFELKIDREAIKAKIAKRFLECSEALFSSGDGNEKFVLTPERVLSSESGPSGGDSLKVGNQAKVDKELVANVASEAPALASNHFSDEMEGCRAAFEEFVKSRTEGAVVDSVGKGTQTDFKKTVSPEKKTKDVLVDARVPVENRVLTTPTPPSTSNKATDTSCGSHVCTEKCKEEDEEEEEEEEEDKSIINNDGTDKSCEESCDFYKDPRKCDCAYCEVFGSNVPTLSHKGSETRERLRTRLNQRKEKTGVTPKSPVPQTVTPEPCCKPQQPKAPAAPDANDPKKTTVGRPAACSHSKTSSCENCVPINIKVLSNPPDPKPMAMPIICLEQPKIEERPDLSDIDGLIDFIQGNKPIDKAAMARKKAAKKARQKIKKEQARLRREEEEEAKKAEEKRIKEEKLKDELKAQAAAKHQAEQLKKKKQGKLDGGEQQAAQQQKQEAPPPKKQVQPQRKAIVKQTKPKTDLMEETIPAMVTIKRIVENKNSPPTVTITLKGSTPDQDKLLYTLVNGHTKDYLAAHSLEGKDKFAKKKNKKPEKKPTKVNNGEANDKEKKKKKPPPPPPPSSSSSSPPAAAAAPDSKGVVTTTNEFKVTLSVDKSFHKSKEAAENAKKNNIKQRDTTAAQAVVNKSVNKTRNVKANDMKKPDEVKKPEEMKKPDEVKKPEVKEFRPHGQHRPNNKDADIDIPSLRLPPGITITKVNGPLMHKNCKPPMNTSSSTPAHYQNVPVSKSGVIVVDTEKLIQQSITANANKKNKKRKNKGKASSSSAEQTGENAAGNIINNNNNNNNNSNSNTSNSSSSKPNAEEKPAMVTLKNPIFHTLQTKLVEKNEAPVIPCNEQASITKGENGMVTIRRPRCLQLPIEKDSSMTEFLNELKPIMGANASSSSFGANKPKEEPKQQQQQQQQQQKCPGTNGLVNNVDSNSFMPNYASNGDYNDESNSYFHNNVTNLSNVSKEPNRNGLSAHEILWGLPGIEITKITRSINSGEYETTKKSCQAADVSIIPTGTGPNNGEKFNFDRDDWPFESVFAPKDILEDDLDADERELEAFKRFCQQSIPPKHKEKVAHLNVKDIVLKKKNDITYS